jgi:hypothetical protein
MIRQKIHKGGVANGTVDILCKFDEKFLNLARNS